jgi:hypothetical protein
MGIWGGFTVIPGRLRVDPAIQAIMRAAQSGDLDALRAGFAATRAPRAATPPAFVATGS